MKVKNADTLKSELVRSYIFGHSATRRSVDEIKKDIADLMSLEEAKQLLADCDREIKVVRSLGDKMKELAVNNIPVDSLEYDNVMAQTKEIASYAVTYCKTCYDKNIQQPNVSAIPEQNSQKIAEDLTHRFEQNGLNTKKYINSKIVGMEQQIRKYRTWTNDFDKNREIEDLIEKIGKLDATRVAEAKKIWKDGKKIVSIFEKAYKAGRANNSEDFLKIKDDAISLGATKDEMAKIDQNFLNGQNKGRGFNNARHAVSDFPKPKYDVENTIPFNITTLTKSPQWTIMVDETGSVFDRTCCSPLVPKRNKGKFVALLIPQDNDLPKINKFHATDSSTAGVAKILKQVLTVKKPCGILGVTLEAMPDVSVNYWYTGLERLFSIIFRFLPVEEKSETRLNFFVEQRGETDSKMVQLSADSCLYRLAKADPLKANSLKVRVNVFAKKETKDPVFIAYNGYVDSLACAWNGAREEFSEILKLYGLKNTCLLEGAIQEIYEARDQITQGAGVSPHFWDALLQSPDNARKDSLVSIVVGDLEHCVKKSSEIWHDYLDYVVQHIDSKAINLHALEKQISFLKRCQPDDAEIPPRLQLIWMTARLASNNHRGAAVGEAMPRFKKLIHDLFVEDAPLCCWATLHLAVGCTNVYEFQQARQIIGDYLKLMSSATDTQTSFADDDGASFVESVSKMPISASPVVIPGLKYWGEILSTKGQHEAFMGNEVEAANYLMKAIDIFGLLNDKSEGRRECGQTMAYLATVLIDCAEVDSRIREDGICRYLGCDLATAVKNLATDASDERKYQHHILLRYLTSEYASEELKKAYLRSKDWWMVGYGHPWELIEFYRALLLTSKGEREQHLIQAEKLCDGMDAVLQVICAVFMGSRLITTPTLQSEYLEQVKRCATVVPSLGARLSILEEQPTKLRSPLELAKLVLPFNFR